MYMYQSFCRRVFIIHTLRICQTWIGGDNGLCAAESTMSPALNDSFSLEWKDLSSCLWEDADQHKMLETHLKMI